MSYLQGLHVLMFFLRFDPEKRIKENWKRTELNNIVD